MSGIIRLDRQYWRVHVTLAKKKPKQTCKERNKISAKPANHSFAQSMYICTGDKYIWAQKWNWKSPFSMRCHSQFDDDDDDDVCFGFGVLGMNAHTHTHNATPFSPFHRSFGANFDGFATQTSLSVLSSTSMFLASISALRFRLVHSIFAHHTN